jgi:flagellin-like protein
MSKKAVSPLIATVLLLAFAVSIATIIVPLEPFDTSCSAFEAEITNVGEGICYNEQNKTMEFFLKNKKYEIENMKVAIIANDAKNINVNIIIEPYHLEKIIIPFDKSKLKTPKEIQLTIFHKNQNKIEECTQTIKLLSFNNCK